MNDLENNFLENQTKNKINVKMPHVSKKPLAGKGNLFQTKK